MFAFIWSHQECHLEIEYPIQPFIHRANGAHYLKGLPAYRSSYLARLPSFPVATCAFRPELRRRVRSRI